MGNKHSRRRGGHSYWQEEEPHTWYTVDSTDVSLDVHDLTRSTKGDKKQNTFGLGDNVLLLILKDLNLNDLGRCAMVCKTWRRLSLEDYLWTRFAEELNLAIKDGESIRARVLETIGQSMAEDFTYIPSGVESNFNELCRQEDFANNVPIIVLSLFGTHVDGGGCGKSAMVIRAVQRVFVEMHDPTVEDSYRKMTSVGVLDILDTAGQEEYTALRSQYFISSSNCTFVVCSTLQDGHTLGALQELVEEIKKARDGNRFSIIFARTKSDLYDKVKEKRSILNWCEMNKVPFFSTSAKSGINCDSALMYAAALQKRPEISRKMD